MCGLWPDLKIANEKLLPLLDKGKCYFAHGFQGGRKAIIPKQLTVEEKSMARARHATANTRLKNGKFFMMSFGMIHNHSMAWCFRK